MLVGGKAGHFLGSLLALVLVSFFVDVIKYFDRSKLWTKGFTLGHTSRMRLVVVVRSLQQEPEAAGNILAEKGECVLLLSSLLCLIKSGIPCLRKSSTCCHSESPASVSVIKHAPLPISH